MCEESRTAGRAGRAGRAEGPDGLDANKTQLAVPALLCTDLLLAARVYLKNFLTNIYLNSLKLLFYIRPA